jgi:hypothetical protein
VGVGVTILIHLNWGGRGSPPPPSKKAQSDFLRGYHRWVDEKAQRKN